MAAQAVLSDADVWGSAAPPPGPMPMSPPRRPAVTVIEARRATPEELNPEPEKPLSDADVWGAAAGSQAPPSIHNGFAGLGQGEIKAPMIDAGPLGAISAFGDSVVDHLTGGYGNKFVAGLESLPALFSGQDAGAAYTKNLNRDQALTSQYAGFHPNASAAGAPLGILGQGALFPEAGPVGMMAQGAGLGAVNATGHVRGDAGAILSQAVPGAIEGGGIGLLSHGVFGSVAAKPPGVLAPYERVGVDPSLAVNGGRTIQQISQMTKGLPFVGTPLAQAADRTATQLSERVGGTASRLGPAVNPQEAGAALQRGADQAVVGMKTTKDALYQPVNALEANPTPIPMANTQAQIAAMFAKFPTIPDWLEKSAPTLVHLRDTLAGAGGHLTFGEARALRTDVGTMIKDGFNVGGVDQGRLKQLYGAMSDDLSAGAGQLGGPKAQAAVSRADTYNSAMQTRMEDTLAATIKAKSPEDAYRRVVAAASAGGGADIQSVQRLKRSLDPDAWNEFTSGLIHTMGRQKPGDPFAPAVFATEYARLTPGGKEAIFGRGGLKADMDAFASIAADQQAAAKFYNHSNSGHLTTTGAIVAEGAATVLHHGIEGAAMMTGLGALGYGGARLLASPGFARTMLKATRARPGAADQMFLSYAKAHPALAPYVNAFRAKLPSIGTAGAVGSQPRPSGPTAGLPAL